MRIRKKKWAEPELAECRYYINEPEQYRGRWKEFFGNEKPIELEIGCGKCTFSAEKAIRDPDKNFIALDIKSDMLGVGRRNVERIFAENDRSPDNIALVRCNVEQIDKAFSADDHIAVMYINFCNPWPREKHKKRRLTYPRKLKMYRDFLTEDAVIYFKTDDDELFEESIGYFEQAGYTIRFITRDLHHSEVRDNIMTEHEKMFSDEGIPIKYLEATV
ncbi:tRNA (guanosine(46)-N7)-methyltransferase TrmB [Ruminococcus difficilis]|uniref:tRNA (guanine-N(7)-)-methyltransferase n=1 Tax=Ruminococcus difficilis TaxID=2763069 RepID=A0A935C3X7_9FIRM|nr:tRNA (guanosine(46)-N7)-methyltransferase TrmB [Ruminococcus difficilis]MBK6089970.1 tRNA (guanosine(46)-N7)-methyltransferase TrmB [Ruminococcus difficilis]